MCQFETKFGTKNSVSRYINILQNARNKAFGQRQTGVTSPVFFAVV